MTVFFNIHACCCPSFLLPTKTAQLNYTIFTHTAQLLTNFLWVCTHVRAPKTLLSFSDNKSGRKEWDEQPTRLSFLSLFGFWMICCFAFFLLYSDQSKACSTAGFGIIYLPTVWIEWILSLLQVQVLWLSLNDDCLQNNCTRRCPYILRGGCTSMCILCLGNDWKKKRPSE